jgi:dihydroorotase
MRDIAIAEYLDLPIHFAHISTAGAIRAIREAKARGVKVSCEVTPHHFALTQWAVREFDTNAKMNPPLRSASDVEEIIKGIADGTVDCIATDHAPHHIDKKNCEFDIAAFGIVGLETALGLTVTELVDKVHIDFKRMIELLSVNPAKIISAEGGSLTKGGPADITIFDPEKQWTVHASRFKSKSRNTPFDGATLKGAPAGVVVDGTVILPNDLNH